MNPRTLLPLVLALLAIACDNTEPAATPAGAPAVPEATGRPDAPVPAIETALTPQERTIRVFSEEWLSALHTNYPPEQHPGVTDLIAAFEASRDTPTEPAFDAARDMATDFSDTLPADEQRAFRRMADDVEMMVFARMNLIVMRLVAERFTEEFSPEEYPHLSALLEYAAELDIRDPTARDQFDRAYRDFLDSLSPASRQRANDIEAEIRQAWGMV